MHDTPQKYGLLSKILHWSIGLLILFQFLKVFERWNEKQNFISALVPPWHGSIGVILFFLIAIRIFWSIIQLKNRQSDSVAAKVGHLAIYVFMFLAPVTAICRMLSKGYPIKTFGLELVSKSEPNTALTWIGNLHSPISIVLMVLVIGHIAMAIYHQIQAKKNNTTGVLEKMI